MQEIFEKVRHKPNARKKRLVRARLKSIFKCKIHVLQRKGTYNGRNRRNSPEELNVLNCFLWIGQNS